MVGNSFHRKYYLPIIALLVAINAGLIGFSIFTVKESRDSAFQAAFSSTSNIAEGLSQAISSFIEKGYLGIRSVAQEAEAQLATGGVRRGKIDPYIKKLVVDLPFLHSIRVTDANGDLRYGIEPGTRASVADRDYFLRLRDDPSLKFVVSNPAVGRISGLWAIFIACRYNRPDGTFAGIVLSGIPLENLERLFSTVNLGKDGLVSLRGPDLGLIVRHPVPRGTGADIGQTGVSPRSREIFESGKTEASYVARASSDGIERVISYRRIPAYPLHMIVGVPTKGLMERWWTELYAAVTLVAATSLLSVFAVWLSITFKKRGEAAEAALRESESRYRRLHESMMDAFVLVRMDGTIEEHNRAYQEMTGYPGEELLGLTYFDLTPARWHPFEARIVEEQVLPRGYSDVYEKEYRRKDGTVFPIEMRVFLLRDQKGHPSGMWAIVRDVTGRKRAEDVLRESEERYAGLVEGTQDLITRFDPGGRFVFVNRTSGSVFGLSPAECVGRQAFDFVHPEDKARTMEWFRECVASRAAEGSIENRQIGLGGRVRPMQWRSTFHYDGQGNLVSVDGIARDITESHRVEEELRRSENRFSTVFRASPVCTSLTRLSDGLFLDVNDAFLRLFGYDREEVIGRNPLMLGMWANTDDRATMVGILRERGRCDGFETTFRTKSGEIRNVMVISEVVDIAEEKYILGLTLDITDRKRAEEEKGRLEGELQQAMKMEAVGRLAGGVAHDFNNLLTVISGYSELLLQKVGKESPMHAQVEEIKRAAERAAELTRQLLAFSRKQIIEPKVVRMDRLVAEVLTMLTRLIGEDIALQTTTGKALGSVKVDPGQFQQILMNLAVNARDAMPGGGKITIETANVDLDERHCALHPYLTPGRFVMLSFSDTGKGMSEEVKARIFEPFFTTKGLGSGTGLGLATTYGAVRQAGGSIDAHSEVGKGTTFRIYLPRVEEEAAKPVKNDRAADIPGGSETVMIVEDEDTVRNLCARVLGDLGYRVMQARNGAEAIAEAVERGDRIDLLLTDVVMPGMSGSELATQLALHHPGMKVLFSSGYTEDTIVHHGVEDKGLSFIGKPYSPEGLSRKVREILDRA